jgi:hypothetical protein
VVVEQGTKGLSSHFPLYIRAFHSTWIDRDIRFNMCDVLASQCRNTQMSSDEMSQICDRLADMASVVLNRSDDTPETWSLILVWCCRVWGFFFAEPLFIWVYISHFLVVLVFVCLYAECVGVDPFYRRAA